MRRRNWIITENFKHTELTEELEEQVNHTISTTPHFRYSVYQFEKGEQETLHYHAYVETIKATTFKTIKKHYPRADIQPRRGTRKQVIDYCSKTETRVKGPFKLGEATNQGQRSDLIEVQDCIKQNMTKREIYESYPLTSAKYPRFINQMIYFRSEEQAQESYLRDPLEKQVTLIYGEPGTGKTRYVFDKHNIQDIYVWRQNGGSSSSVWFDGYENQSVILLDDFSGSQMKFKMLLNLLDIYPMQMQTKGSQIYLNWKHLYLTSNSHFEDWYYYDNNRKSEALARRIHNVIKL